MAREASGAAGRDGHRGRALLTQQVLRGEGGTSPGTGRPGGSRGLTACEQEVSACRHLL